MTEVIAYIALGANVGDPAGTLRRALERLHRIDGIEVRRISQFLKTQPLGGPEDQPAYLNAAAELHTTLSPQELLAVMHEVEAQLGRDRRREVRFGPRTCDLDLLLYGDTVLDTPGLTIPHPRMYERKFVLEPLARIAPHRVVPGFDKTIAELLKAFEGGT